MEDDLVRLKDTKLRLENTTLILLSRNIKKHKEKNEIERLLTLAQSAKFHKVELYLFRESGNTAAVIDSYLSDDEMQQQVFIYIHNLFQDIKNETNAKQQIGQHVPTWLLQRFVSLFFLFFFMYFDVFSCFVFCLFCCFFFKTKHFCIFTSFACMCFVEFACNYHCPYFFSFFFLNTK